LKGTEALSELYEFRLELKSRASDIDVQSLIGEVAVAELEAQGGAKRYFSGQIVRVAAQGQVGKYWRYEAVIAPKLWHASRRSDFKIWQNVTVQTIVTEILAKNAVRYEWRLKGEYKVWEYLVQYGETDLSFVLRLLENEGIYFWFEHGLDGEKLVLADHFSTHETFGGYEAIPFYPPDRARSDEDQFFSWSAARVPEPGHFVHCDYDFKHPSRDLTTTDADPRGHLFDQYEIFAYPGNYVESNDGCTYASARLEELQLQQDTIELEGRVRGVTPGYRFKLTNHPRQEQNRELVTVRAAYSVTNDDYEGATDSVEAHYQARIEAMPADRQFRPMRRTPKPRTRGPETAVVVGPAGSQIHTDQYGRVKVHFHWDRYGLRDGSDSAWIRVSYPWAGDNYGSIYIPRVGQEVIVDFEYGDPDRPIVIGRVYNAEQMPPWPLPANKTQSGILTRSSLGGTPANANALRFEDATGQEQIWMHAERDLDVGVENNETRTIGVNQTIEIGGSKIESIRVAYLQNVGVGRVENVGAAYNLNVGAGIITNVGAAYNLNVGAGIIINAGAAYNLNVGAGSVTKVGGAYKLDVGGGNITDIGGAYNLNIGAGMIKTIGEVDLTTVGGQKLTLVGDRYMMTAGGAASVILMDGGGISLIAGAINLN